MHKAEEEIRV